MSEIGRPLGDSERLASSASHAGSASAIASGQGIRWHIHLWTVPLIFIALSVLHIIAAVAGHLLGGGRIDAEASAMAIVTGTGWAIVALVSLGCWWAIVIRIFERGRPLLGAVVFLTLPISYLPLFIFGWAKSADLGCERPLLVWTYCFAIALLLPMAWLLGAVAVMSLEWMK